MILTRFSKGILTLLLTISMYALQAQTNDHILQVPETLSEKQLSSWKKSLPKDGWFILRFKKDADRLFNYSNKDYEMSLWLNCTEKGKPGFLIEYSDSYGDGNYGGIDYISSNAKNGNRIQFLLDGKNFGDPFAKGDDKLTVFKAALKKAHKLTLSVYGNEFNPRSGKDEEKLNRSIEFKLAHGELLDRPVNCGK
ncbi:hypothetical protein FFJ24_000430 [Pedobacter sp. KBS0701]|uniref:hypothetical protein n=1 Tax=Pedobacter sp. KBS0701 TaxID=2578106 RepID=UPI00110E12A2|nr:hypothetical protein [Pedobacter sp. KBS0701]QDW23377.1 hypothetical protein FFJ24_000430 [Pedobacter sp. KBS0701]